MRAAWPVVEEWRTAAGGGITEPVMAARSFLLTWLVSGACLAPGCGVPAEPRPYEFASNHMPDGATWDGVYHGSGVGQLHLVTHGSTVQGAWRTVSENAYGELTGEVRGNLLSYRWVERDLPRAGGAVHTGTGYFVYVVKEPGKEHELLGERVYESHSAPWHAKKWNYVEPDLWNVVPGGASTESEETDGDYFMNSDDDT